MPYKDKDKQREANKIAARKFRLKLKTKSKRVWVNPFYSLNFTKLVELHPMAIWWENCWYCGEHVYLFQRAGLMCDKVCHLECMMPFTKDLELTKSKVPVAKF